MIWKNIILIITFLIISIFWINVFANDNKSELLSKITTLETNLTTLKINSIKDLETKVLTLSRNFDDTLSNLWFDSKVIDYLVWLWKINSNFKNELTSDFTLLSREISDKSSTELNSLNAIKNNITINYTSISNNEKVTLLNSINSIENNYINLSDSFSSKINILNNKYSTNLVNYKENLKKSYNENIWSINLLNEFSSKFESLYNINATFEKNYTIFKETYLTFVWDLTIFSTNKQKYYIDILKKELEKIRDANMQANKALENYKLDINRLIDILLENFKNSLSLKVNDSYWIIYSDIDINSIVSKYNTIKNKFYDLDWKLKSTEVISNTWAIEDLNFTLEKLSVINTKIVNLIWTWSNSNSYENVKIRLENEMIKFYNSNYQKYREDLLLKLKEKLNILALEAKNTILASDTIDLRYSLLNDKISKSDDIDYINNQISDFKKYTAKYNYLNSDILNKKLIKINYNLWIFVVKKELTLPKYNKMDKTKYDKKLYIIFDKLKSKYPDKYIEKLNTVLDKIDKSLSLELDDKTRFKLLCIKLNIFNILNNIDN